MTTIAPPRLRRLSATDSGEGLATLEVLDANPERFGYDPSDADDVKAATELFDGLKSENYAAFVTEPTEIKGNTKSFKPEALNTAFARPHVGG